MSFTHARGAIGAVVACALLHGCSSGPAPKPIEVVPTVMRDVHPALRGTIGSEVEFRNVQDVLASGFGLVVGLRGTGGGELPDTVAATMEREMGLMGIGKANVAGGSPLDGRTPRQVLRDPNVAVVLVQAAIPPGAPANSRFDVYVKALNATSLEGGTLWTTELRFGQPAVFGAAQQKTVARAKGPIFVNPFAVLGGEKDGQTRDSGRVLDGGAITQPQPIILSLDNQSWARARGMVSSINSRFPEGPGDPGPTARGRSASLIEVRVPRRYRLYPGEFLELVKHLPVENQYPEELAKRYAEAMRAEPALAEDLSWCLEAVGTKAIPFLRGLYGSPELAPRLGALRAGARLNDPLAADGLKALARDGSGSVRLRAIQLLGELDGGPSVDLALRDLVAAQELVVRVGAYEALAQRAERSQRDYLRRSQSEAPDAARISPTAIEVLAQSALPRGNLQGIDRKIVGGKFLLDIVPYGDPLIYVAQQGQPRVVLFGQDQMLLRPALAGAWNERLVIRADETGPVRVRYTPPNSIGAVTKELDNTSLVALIDLLARDNEPDSPASPGLDMSYSEIVGALSAMSESKAVAAGFATEQNKLRAQLLAAGAGRDQVERPEKPGDEPVLLHDGRSITSAAEPVPAQEPRIVPITPPAKK